MPRIPYDKLEQLISAQIASHADEPVKEPVTDATVKIRLDDIAKALLDLMPEFMAQQVDRDEFRARQQALMDEQEQLRHTGSGQQWRETGETVGDKWARLNEAERRLWLLRIGTTFRVHRGERSQDGKRQQRWLVESSWRPVDDDDAYRERIVRQPRTRS